MNGIEIRLEEPTFPELREKKNVLYVGEGSVIGIGGLERGTTGADPKPTVAIKIDLPDSGPWGGSTVLAETTLALFLTAADALKERFGDPRTEARVRGSEDPHA